MAARESLTFLHLSDPQFGKHHRFGSGDSFDTLFQRLTDDLHFLHTEKLTPELIVVSGDLAEWGLKSEFQEALSFLVKLSDLLKVPRRRIVLVPGNHDINRKLCEAYFAQCDGEDQKPVEPYWPKWKHYHSLFQEFYAGEKDISFTMEEPWSYWEIEELNVAIAALNSTMKESHLDGSHYGWVGEPQLASFSKKLANAQEKGWFRLGVVHHNVQRGAVEDDENLRDVENLERILGPSVNILLHGHTHNSKLGWLSQSVPILATGSAALKRDALPTEVPNQYQAIRIWQNRIERWTRRYERNRWIGDTSSSEDGSSWRTEKKVSFESVHGIFPKAVRRQSRRESKKLPEPSEERFGTEKRSFAEQVAEVCKLRNPGATVAIIKQEDSRNSYLRVRSAEDRFARVFPIGICDGEINAERLEMSGRSVFAHYRALDTTLPCEIVYSGPRVSEDLLNKAASDGIRLSSFTEFQGIIDFRGYIQRQTRNIEADLIYPPSLYVPQRFEYEIGRDRHESRDACESILQWVREPLARFILVLGDFGAGKTFLLHEVARRMAVEVPHVVPMLIELRSLEKAGSVEQLIAQHMAAAGERYIDLAAFPYMLREGRIALLFDGFDELASRISYERAADHFETLTKAAEGRAKIVVTSRTQHFESDRQVKTALFERTVALPGLHLARIHHFDTEQILQFLQNLLGDRSEAEQRLELIRDIQDLLGLSHNARMLSFIAKLPEEQLREAQQRTGKITSAELYRLLIERWLTHEYERVQPKGAAPTLSVEERWKAVTALALCLWPRLERTIQLTELTDEVGRALTDLAHKQLAPQQVAHLVGSGTLLVRDEAGTFAFVHQSVMEWLVANDAAQQLASRAVPNTLALKEMSPLMADLFRDLAGEENAGNWAATELAGESPAGPYGKTNAQLVLSRLGTTAVAVTRMASQNLRAKDFSGQELYDADFAGADLTEARFTATGLKRANFTKAILEGTDFTKSDLLSANLSGVRAGKAKFLGANLTNATLHNADLRRTKFVGAQVSAFSQCNTFGAAPPDSAYVLPQISWASLCNSIAVSVHGILATGHDDGTVRLWDLETGQELRSLRGHEGAVRSVVFSSDGARLASGGNEDKAIRLWDAETGQELRSLRGHSSSIMSMAFSPDGSQLLSGGDDNTLRLWDSRTGQELLNLQGHETTVMSVAFSPDGSQFLSGGDDYTLRLWDARTGEELRGLKGHANYVRSVSFSPDGARLLSGSDDKTARLWDMRTGQELRSMRGHESSVISVAFSPDGAQMASRGDPTMVRLWDTETGEELRHLSGPESYIWNIVFTQENSQLLSGGDYNTVRLWNTRTGEELRNFRSQKSFVLNVAFSPDGTWLASGGADHTVRLWHTQTGQEVHSLRGHEDLAVSVAFSPDGTWLASGGADHTVRLWHTQTGQEVHSLRGHEGGVMSVAFSPTGGWLASGSNDKTIRLWDAQTRQEVRTLLGHESYAWSVAFRPDGVWLASGGADNTVRLWDTRTGQQLHIMRGHTYYVRSVAFSSDGIRVASGSDDKTIRLWEARTGQELRVIQAHESSVRSVVFSPDGTRIASTGADKTIRLWDVRTGQELRILRGHGNTIFCVAFSPDGARLASAGIDNTVRLWDVESGKLLLTLVPAADGWAAFTPDNRYKFAGNLGGAFWFAINLCRFEPGELDPYLPPGTLQQLAVDQPF